MAGPVEIERKVRQLDNDVRSIYEMLSTITSTQTRHGNRLNEIAAVQSDHGQKLDDQGQKLDDQGQKLDDHGQKLDAILDLLRGNQPS